MQNKIGERLKKLRSDSGLSQAKLGAILGIPQQTYDKWEQYKSQPDADMLIRLSLYFDVTLDYLIGATNNMYHNEHNEHNDTVATVNGNNNNFGIIGGKNNRVSIKK